MVCRSQQAGKGSARCTQQPLPTAAGQGQLPAHTSAFAVSSARVFPCNRTDPSFLHAVGLQVSGTQHARARTGCLLGRAVQAARQRPPLKLTGRDILSGWMVRMSTFTYRHQGQERAGCPQAVQAMRRDGGGCGGGHPNALQLRLQHSSRAVHHVPTVACCGPPLFLQTALRATHLRSRPLTT